MVTKNNTFSNRLKNLMSEQNLTQDSLAKSIGISRQAIAQYLEGTTQPKADKIYTLAKYFNVSADYLLGLSEISTTNETIQGIHNKTGLSSQSIIKLITEKHLQDFSISNFISSIIENDNIDKLIEAVKRKNFFSNSDEYVYMSPCQDSTHYIAEEFPASSVYKIYAESIFWDIVKDYNIKGDKENGNSTKEG